MPAENGVGLGIKADPPFDRVLAALLRTTVDLCRDEKARLQPGA